MTIMNFFSAFGMSHERMRRTLASTMGTILFVFLLFPFPSHASESLRAAVAANFMIPFKEISAAFEAETKVKVEATFASTGSLYAQIMNGAPYDVFLAADEKRPKIVFEKGLGDTPFIYAAGRVVLWGTGKNFCGAANWKDALLRKDIKRIAIANPAAAPYGAAAEYALKQSTLWAGMESRIVTAQNVGQAFQYALTGGVDASFCALSSALSSQGGKGCHYMVEEAPPIRQAACLLKRSAGQKEALLFLKFLSSPRAEAIKKRYGYH
jgi:molybdate transport system substrate-binding protein